MMHFSTQFSWCLLVKLSLLLCIVFGYSSHAMACTGIEYRIGRTKPSGKTEQFKFPGSSAYVHVESEPMLTQKDIKAAKIVDARGYGMEDVLEVFYEPAGLESHNIYFGESNGQGLAIFVCDEPVYLSFALQALDAPEAWIAGMSLHHMNAFIEVIRSGKNSL